MWNVRFVGLNVMVSSLLSFASATPAQTKHSTLPVQDASEPGSPFAVTGTVTIRETLSGDRLESAFSDTISVRNVSNKTVLVAVFQLDVKPAYAGPESDTRQYECFFARDVIPPGHDHDISRPSSGSISVELMTPGRLPDVPRAQLRTLFVQFTDGSTYGEQTHARHILSLRRQTWQHLKRLDRIYAHQGEQEFVQELLQPVEPTEVNTYFEAIRQAQRQLGTAVAIGQVRQALHNANQHQAAFAKE